ncbi:MAG: glycosyltransferase involved in cell wall biosynthesis [Planctomycetota bacterium]|jgi:glycosyltransferase involved in cell wall biosynthesis
MIARNEERFLAECLRSVRGIVSECIVVDTGSTDRTKAIAAEAGATVLDFPWCDDFAAARNVGVEAASGTHILVLDADERLAPGMGPNLIKAASNPKLLLGCLALYNASEMDATFDEVLDGVKLIGEPAFVPRLFRNLPEMRFKRRVHESLTDGFNDLQSRGVGLSAAVGAALVHYGDVPTFRADMAKDDRNNALLRKCVEEDPADGEVGGYLVVDLIRRGDWQEALEVGERHFGPFLARNENRPEGYLPENMVRIGYALGLVQIEAGRPQDAILTTQASRRHTPDGHPNLDYIEGLAQLGLGELDEAERLFKATLAVDGQGFAQPVLPAITAELSKLKLAGIALLRGDLEAVGRELPPRAGKWMYSVDLVLAEVDLAKGAPEKAMERLALYVDRKDAAPDWYALVHQALTAMGENAENLLELARAAQSTKWLERRRASVLR